jgi:hypothetical protein
MRPQTQQANVIVGGSFADLFTLGVSETGERVGYVNAADIGGGALSVLSA